MEERSWDACSSGGHAGARGRCRRGSGGRLCSCVGSLDVWVSVWLALLVGQSVVLVDDREGQERRLTDVVLERSVAHGVVSSGVSYLSSVAVVCLYVSVYACSDIHTHLRTIYPPTVNEVIAKHCTNSHRHRPANPFFATQHWHRSVITCREFPPATARLPPVPPPRPSNHPSRAPRTSRPTP